MSESAVKTAIDVPIIPGSLIPFKWHHHVTKFGMVRPSWPHIRIIGPTIKNKNKICTPIDLAAFHI